MNFQYHSKALLTSSSKMNSVIGDRENGAWVKAMKIAEQGDLQGAADIVITIFNGPHGEEVRKIFLDCKLEDFFHEKSLVGSHREEAHHLLDNAEKLIWYIGYSSVIYTIGNMACITDQIKGSVLSMLKIAVDNGLLELSYNIANAMMDTAKSPADYAEVEKYYLLAIEHPDCVSNQAAAYVNYCPIIRDGLMTGSPDLPKAIEIYEAAAKLGLVIGMFNCANVCCWLEGTERQKFVHKAVYWLEKMFERLDSSEPLLDMDNPVSLKILANTAHWLYGRLNLDAEFDGADIDVGIDHVRLWKPTTSCEIKAKAWYLDRAMSTKLSLINKPDLSSPTRNWKYVFDSMGWITQEVVDHNGFGILSIFTGEPSSALIYIVVIDGFFNPGEVNRATNHALMLKKELNLPYVAVLSKFAMFKARNSEMYTAITYFKDNEPLITSLRPAMSAHDLLVAMQGRGPFIDGVSYSNSCALSIAVNVLQLGLPVKDNFNFNAEYGVVNNWCVPMLRSFDSY